MTSTNRAAWMNSESEILVGRLALAMAASIPLLNVVRLAALPAVPVEVAAQRGGLPEAPALDGSAVDDFGVGDEGDQLEWALGDEPAHAQPVSGVQFRGVQLGAVPTAVSVFNELPQLIEVVLGADHGRLHVAVEPVRRKPKISAFVEEIVHGAVV
jgi:hypothetical protein